MRSGMITLAVAIALTADTAAAQADFEGISQPRHPPRMGQPPPDEVKLTAAGRAEFESFSRKRIRRFDASCPAFRWGSWIRIPLRSFSRIIRS